MSNQHTKTILPINTGLSLIINKTLKIIIYSVMLELLTMDEFRIREITKITNLGTFIKEKQLSNCKSR